MLLADSRAPPPPNDGPPPSPAAAAAAGLLSLLLFLMVLPACSSSHLKIEDQPVFSTYTAHFKSFKLRLLLLKKIASLKILFVLAIGYRNFGKVWGCGF
jgi:hypothetical protein